MLPGVNRFCFQQICSLEMKKKHFPPLQCSSSSCFPLKPVRTQHVLTFYPRPGNLQRVASTWLSAKSRGDASSPHTHSHPAHRQPTPALTSHQASLTAPLSSSVLAKSQHPKRTSPRYPLLTDRLWLPGG